jgi:hypothetical protein
MKIWFKPNIREKRPKIFFGRFAPCTGVGVVPQTTPYYLLEEVRTGHQSLEWG